MEDTLVGKARSLGRRLCPALYSDCRAAAAASERSMRFALRLLDRYRALGAAEAAPLQGSLVALIVQNASYADERARAADVLALLIAGHDTTAYQLGWALSDLAGHAHEQAALREALAVAGEPRECAELARAIQVSRVMPPRAALSCFSWWRAAGSRAHALTRGRAVLAYASTRAQESMRLHCVAAGGSVRVLARDLPLPANCQGRGAAGGRHTRHIPKDSVVQVHAHTMLHDAEVFAAPDSYDPERWASIPDWGAVAFPFALGRRNCVGQALARVEMAAVVAALVARFEMEVAAEPAPSYCLTYKPSGLRLRLRPVGAPAVL
jgi:cytochrome P450